MYFEDLIKAIEELNSSYNKLLNSQEYRIGKRMLELKKDFSLVSFFKYFRSREIEKKIQRKNPSLAIKPSNTFGKKIIGLNGAIYTCITNGYDSVKEPLFKPLELTYYCFAEKKISSESIWVYKKIPSNILLMGNCNANRYCKMHPFSFFENYDFSIYIDGNIRTISDMSLLYDIAKKSKTGLALHIHSRRQCVYEEIEACLLYGKGDANALLRYKKKLEEESFPKNFGLFQASVIVVDLKNAYAKKILDAWWNEYNTSKTQRDQLTLPYVIWKMGFKCSDVGFLGNDAYCNPKYQVISHGM